MAGMDMSRNFRIDWAFGVDLLSPPASPPGEEGNHPSFASVLSDVMVKHDPDIVPVNTPPAAPLPDQTTPDGHIMDDKIQKSMRKRSWTPEQIDRAVRHGQRIDAINKATGGSATRYVDPESGRSVVIDNTTNRVIQVIEPDFKFGPKGGDAPGAGMRPAPEPPVTEPPAAPGPGDRVVPSPEEPTIPELPEIPTI